MKLAWLVLAVALVACAEPQFPHRAHLESRQCGGPGQPRCPTCASCHTIASRQSPAPRTESCARCHGDGQRWPRHRLSEDEVVRTTVRFDHTAHLTRGAGRGQCVMCHGGVVAADRTRFPTMASCFSGCHGGSIADSDCAECHDARLRSVVPRTFLRHDLAFMGGHGAEATARGQVCARCHAQSDCAACHDNGQPLGLAQRHPEGIDRERNHRADFVARHAIEARSDSASCARCHQASSCDGCHVQRGVSGQSAFAASPHPIGWVGPEVTGPNFHGRVARRDIVLCASCHDQGPATNCIRCHAVGAIGGNPHPSGWRSARAPSDTMCRYCHAP